jgi:hypothetical protein
MSKGGSSSVTGGRQYESSQRAKRLARELRNEVRARHRNPEIAPRPRGEGVKKGGYTR